MDFLKLLRQSIKVRWRGEKDFLVLLPNCLFPVAAGTSSEVRQSHWQAPWSGPRNLVQSTNSQAVAMVGKKSSPVAVCFLYVKWLLHIVSSVCTCQTTQCTRGLWRGGSAVECTALTGDLGLFPSTCACLLTYNSSSGRSETLFWALWVPALSWHTNIDMHKYIH